MQVWIWNLGEQHFPGAVRILDLYHARQHLWELARRLHPNDESRTQPIPRRQSPRMLSLISKIRAGSYAPRYSIGLTPQPNSQPVNPTWISNPSHAMWQRARPDRPDGTHHLDGRSHGCGEVTSHATRESGRQMRNLPPRIQAGQAAEGPPRGLYRLKHHPRHSDRS